MSDVYRFCIEYNCVKLLDNGPAATGHSGAQWQKMQGGNIQLAFIL